MASSTPRTSSGKGQCQSSSAIVNLFFINYKDKDPDKKGKPSAQCKQCKKRIAGHRSTTSNFRRHAEQHPTEFKKFLEEEKEFGKQGVQGAGQHTIDRFITKYKSSDPRQVKLINSVALNLVVDCDLAFNIVERPGFMRFMEVIDPRYGKIERRALNTVVKQAVVTLHEELKKTFEDVDTVCLTLDIWSDRQMRGFLGVTSHYTIKGKPELQSTVLAVDRFKGKHTGDHIFDHYTTIISEFGIERKISTVVTDNASNMKKAFSVSLTLDGEQSEEASMQEDIWNDTDDTTMEAITAERISCFSHSLQLVVNDGLKDKGSFRSALSKCSALCTALHTRTAFKEAFETKFGRAGIPAENETRWNSTLRQVKAIVKKEMVPLNAISGGQEKRELIFTGREWAILTELLDVLEPFAEATDELSGEKMVTISMVIPAVLSLHKHVEGLIHRPLQYLLPVARNLRDSLTKRFEGVFTRLGMANSFDIEKAPFSSKVYLAATVLDPNFKLFWVDDLVEVGSDDDLDPGAENERKAAIKARLTELLRLTTEQLYPPLQAVRREEEEGDNTGVTDDAVTPPRKRLLLGRYAGRLSEPAGTADNLPRSISTQLESYFNWSHDGLVDGQLDAIQFWQCTKAAEMLPNLAMMAIRVLSIPASSAPVERVFSHGSIIMRPHRASMADDTLSHLIVLKCNRMKIK